MKGWICPYCSRTVELHLHLEPNPTTGAARLVCLFDAQGEPFRDRDGSYREFARHALRFIEERDRARSDLAKLRESGLDKLRALALDVSAIVVDLKNACGKDAERRKALETECDRLRPAAERHDAAVQLTRALEKTVGTLEGRIAELEAARTDFGKCGTCGEKATQGVLSELGTFGACGSAAHMKDALAEFSLKCSKTRPPS